MVCHPAPKLGVTCFSKLFFFDEVFSIKKYPPPHPAKGVGPPSPEPGSFPLLRMPQLAHCRPLDWVCAAGRDLVDACVRRRFMNGGVPGGHDHRVDGKIDRNHVRHRP